MRTHFTPLKIAAVAVVTGLSYTASGQVKIGNNPTIIDPASVLELENPNKALYLTRVSLTSTQDVTTVPNPKAGMLVYNINTAIASSNANFPASGMGVYYFDGSGWVFSGVGTLGNNFFSLNGNSNATDGVNFLGTTNPQALNFRVNNQRAGRISLATEGNTTFGALAGDQAATLVSGSNNTLIGTEAGSGVTTGKDNSALGYRALQNVQSGSRNTGVGVRAGGVGVGDSSNTFLGYEADVTTSGLGVDSATAIGVGAKVSQSNAVILGNQTARVGVGTTAPNSKLQVVGNMVGGFPFGPTTGATANPTANIFYSSIYSRPTRLNIAGNEISYGVLSHTNADGTGTYNAIAGRILRTNDTGAANLTAALGHVNNPGNFQTAVLGIVNSRANESGATQVFSGLRVTDAAGTLSATQDSNTYAIFSSSPRKSTMAGRVGVGTQNPTNQLHVVAGVNPLRLEGLQVGANGDSLLSVDAATGVVRRVAINTTGAVTTASNGVTKTGNDVALGGTLTQATTINQNGQSLTITGGTLSTNGVSNTGNISTTGATLGATGLTVAGPTTTNGVANTGNITTTSANVGTGGLTVTGATTTNGVTNTGAITNTGALSNTGTLTVVGNNATTLGGTLGVTGATTLGATTVNGTLTAPNLPTGASTDSIVTVTAAGIVRKSSINTLGGLVTASNGLTKVGNDVQLGGTLNAPTTINTTSTNSLTVNGPLNTGNLTTTGTTNTSGTATAGAFTTTGTTTTGTLAVGAGGGTVAGSLGVNGLTTSGNFQTGGNTTTRTLTANGLSNGAFTDSILTIAPGGVVRRVDLNTIGGLTTASNGLTKVGNDIQLGGTLTAATTIAQGGNALTFSGGAVAVGGALTTNGVTNTGNVTTGTLNTTGNASVGGTFGATGATTLGNTLNVAGTTTLFTPVGASTDSILTQDPATGVVRRVAINTTGAITTASNGLTKVGNDVRLGGTLTGTTNIDNGNSFLNLNGVGGGLNVNNQLNAGNATINNNLAVLNGLAVSGSATVNGGITGGNLNTIGNTNTGKVFLNSTLSNTSTSNDLLNIVPGTNEVQRVPIASILGVIGANNGLNRDGNNIQLGGALIEPTTVGTNVTNTLSLTGLQAGASTDSLVTVDAAGVVRRIDVNRTGAVTSASNGLTKVGNDIRLGGTLSAATTIAQAGNSLTFSGGPVTVGGALTTNGVTNTGNIGTGTLTTTGTANIGGVATTNGITNTGNIGTGTLSTSGNATIGGVATTNGITNTGNIGTGTLSTSGNATIGGVATTNGITNTGNTSNTGNASTSSLTVTNLTNTVAGDSILVVSPGGVVRRADLNSVGGLTTASNGLTKVGNDIRLGGTLTAATTIAQAGNSLTFSGGPVTVGGALTTNGVTNTGNIGTGTLTTTGTATIGGVATTNGVTNSGNIGTGTLTTTGTATIGGVATTNGITNTGNVGTGTLSTTGTANIGGVATTNGITNTGNISTTGASVGASGLSVTGSTSTNGVSNTGNATTNSLTVTNTQNGASTDSILTIAPGGVVRRVDLNTIGGLTTASNGLTKVGNDIRLGGTLTAATTIAQAGNSLTFSGGPVTVGGALTTNAVTNTGNIETGTLSTTGTANIGGVATTNGITNTGNIGTGTLSTSGNATIGGTLTVAGVTTLNNTLNVAAGQTTNLGGSVNATALSSGALTDSIVVATPGTGLLRRISANRITDVIKVTNGLTRSSDTIRLGGPLTQPTNVATTLGNDLTVSGAGVTNINTQLNTNNVSVQGNITNVTGFATVTGQVAAGSFFTTGGATIGGNTNTGSLTNQGSTQLLSTPVSADSSLNVLNITPGGLVQQVDPRRFTNVIRARNGLTRDGDSIELGGTLNMPTTIAQAGNQLTISGGTVAISDSLFAGRARIGAALSVGTTTTTDSLRVVNNARIGNNATVGGTLGVTGNTTVTSLTATALGTGTAADNVVTIDGTNVVRRVPLSTLLTTIKAGNGLTKTAPDSISLGGTLQAATTIVANAPNTLRISGTGGLVADTLTGVDSAAIARLNVTGRATVGTTLGVTGAATIGGKLNVTDSVVGGNVRSLGNTTTSTLTATGLAQSLSGTDSLLNVNNGVVSKVSPSAILNNIKAGNGLTKTAPDSISLGGTLQANTTINGNQFNLNVRGSNTAPNVNTVLGAQFYVRNRTAPTPGIIATASTSLAEDTSTSGSTQIWGAYNSSATSTNGSSQVIATYSEAASNAPNLTGGSRVIGSVSAANVGGTGTGVGTRIIGSRGFAAIANGGAFGAIGVDGFVDATDGQIPNSVTVGGHFDGTSGGTQFGVIGQVQGSAGFDVMTSPAMTGMKIGVAAVNVAGGNAPMSVALYTEGNVRMRRLLDTTSVDTLLGLRSNTGGDVRRISTRSILAQLKVGNGLTRTGTDSISLGGTLDAFTTINAIGGNSLDINGRLLADTAVLDTVSVRGLRATNANVTGATSLNGNSASAGGVSIPGLQASATPSNTFVVTGAGGLLETRSFSTLAAPLAGSGLTAGAGDSINLGGPLSIPTDIVATNTNTLRVIANSVGNASSTEVGQGFNVLATSGSFTNAIASRGRIVVPAMATVDQARGINGAATVNGTVSGSANGGYFNGNLAGGSLGSGAIVTGVSADAEATGGSANLTNALIGGRFGSSAANVTGARSVGVLGSAANGAINIGALGVANDATVTGTEVQASASDLFGGSAALAGINQTQTAGTNNFALYTRGALRLRNVQNIASVDTVAGFTNSNGDIRRVSTRSILNQLRVGNGLTKVGQDSLRLGGTLQSNTAINTNGFDFNLGSSGSGGTINLTSSTNIGGSGLTTNVTGNLTQSGGTNILGGNLTVNGTTVTLTSLNGSGTRMVVADANGVLTTQPISTTPATPAILSGSITIPAGASVSGGNAAFFTTIITGVTVGDAVSFSVPGMVLPATVTVYAVTDVNEVSLVFGNTSATTQSITPGTYQIRVIK